jgi:hypothetical protein
MEHAASEVSVSPASMLIVESGQILLFRLFDVADSVDLAAVERILRSPGSVEAASEGGIRLRLQRQRDGVVFTNPPVSARLKDRILAIGAHELPVRVLVKAYDFGVMTIVWALTITPGTSFDELSELSVELESESVRSRLAELMREDATLAVNVLSDGLVAPDIHESQETLTVYAIQRFSSDRAVTAETVAAHPLLPSLLLGERDEFSQQLRTELLRSSYSYSTNDLVVIGYDQALVFDPDGTEDATNLLEFALAQMLELSYYDSQLDDRINRMHRQLSRRRSTGRKGSKNYDELRRDLLTEHLSFSEVIERVNAAVKVTEDLYYAAIYRGAMRVFRANEVADATQHKLEVMYRTYSMLSDEAEAHTSRRLEWIVIVLIMIEVVYGTINVIEGVIH